MKIEKRLFLLFIILVLTLFVPSFVSADNCGGTRQCHCGDTLIESQTMWYDLEDCPEYGLNIGHGVTLDCDNHFINGSGNHGGIYVYTHNVTVTNCVVHDFLTGIELKNAYNNTIIKNTVNNNFWFGITVGGAGNNLLLENIVSNNQQHGILLYTTTGNIVSSNMINNNGEYGIFIDGSSYNSIWNNTFADNFDANALEFSNNNNWNFSNLGNYWSDFSSNPAYPDYYEIPGPGNGIDWHPTGPPLEIIVDDSSSDFFVLTGVWNRRNVVNAYNTETRFNNAGFGDEMATWKVNELVFPGTYDVYVWKFEHNYSSLMGTNVHYMVYHRLGTSNWILVNQQTLGNEWIYLGEFEFDNSHRQGIMITDEANGRVIADAIKLVYTGPLTDAESSWAEVFLI